MIAVTAEYQDSRRKGTRCDVELNGEPIGYIIKDDDKHLINDDLANIKAGYVWRASAGGCMTAFHTKVGAVSAVISKMSFYIAESVLS